MKTLKKFILSFSILFGWVAMFTVLKSFTPDWIYYSVCLTAIILILYDVSRTKKTYWRFYYTGENYTGKGVGISNNEFFPIEEVEKTLNEEVSGWHVITSYMQISKNDYNKIKDKRFK